MSWFFRYTFGSRFASQSLRAVGLSFLLVAGAVQALEILSVIEERIFATLHSLDVREVSDSLMHFPSWSKWAKLSLVPMRLLRR